MPGCERGENEQGAEGQREPNLESWRESEPGRESAKTIKMECAPSKGEV